MPSNTNQQRKELLGRVLALHPVATLVRPSEIFDGRFPALTHRQNVIQFHWLLHVILESATAKVARFVWQIANLARLDLAARMLSAESPSVDIPRLFPFALGSLFTAPADVLRVAFGDAEAAEREGGETLRAFFLHLAPVMADNRGTTQARPPTQLHHV